VRLTFDPPLGKLIRRMPSQAEAGRPNLGPTHDLGMRGAVGPSSGNRCEVHLVSGTR
jgi:hypothetical protein